MHLGIEHAIDAATIPNPAQVRRLRTHWTIQSREDLRAEIKAWEETLAEALRVPAEYLASRNQGHVPINLGIEAALAGSRLSALYRVNTRRAMHYARKLIDAAPVHRNEFGLSELTGRRSRMDEEKTNPAFSPDDLDWHRRVKEIAIECGAEPMCSDLKTISRFVSLKALFAERPTALSWAVRNVPCDKWARAGFLDTLCAVSVDKYVVVVAGGVCDGKLDRVEAMQMIGAAVIEAVRELRELGNNDG